MRDVQNVFSSLVLRSQQTPLDIAQCLSMCGAWWQNERAAMSGDRKAGHHPVGQLSIIPDTVLTMSYTLSLSLRLPTQAHSHTCTDSHTQT